MKVNNLFEPTEQITLEAYLNKMGIESVDRYLKPPTSVLESCYLYDNIRECTNTIKFHIIGNNRIAIIVDPDMDGSCSSYMLYKFLKRQGVTKVRPFIQNGKERGIESEFIRKQILDWSPNLLIIPDAGTNSAKYEDEFLDKGIDICVIDHHDPTDEVCKRAIVVNNTMNQFECNTKLSGTGVVFKVLQALDLDLGTKYSNDFIDLVGMSIISDSMDVRTYENRWFLKYILEDKEHINNPFLYELFETLNDEYTQRDISFRIVPLFNSTIRCGTLEDKQKLFLAFDGKHIDETIQMCQRYHQEQLRRVEKFIEHHQDEIDAQTDSNITIIDATDIPQSFSGLIAGKISGITNKPCIVGKTVNDELGGSFRGYIPCAVMQTMPHVNKAVGHAVGAYGIFLDTSKSQNLDEFRAVIDKMDISTVPTVIASFSANKLQMGVFKEFLGHEDLWGKELDKPRFYIYNVRVNSKDLKLMGTKEDTLKIVLDNYEIMFFKLSNLKKEMFHLDDNVDLNINIIGTLNVNTWRGKKTNQIFVESFEVETITNTFEDLM